MASDDSSRLGVETADTKGGGNEHPEPGEGVEFDGEQIQHVDYLLWSHGATNALRARVTAEMRGERPPEWAVDAAGDLGQPKPPAEGGE